MTDTKPTLEEQMEWAEVLSGCDSGIAPAVLASLKELAAIKSQPVPVEPERIKYVRVEVECGNLSDYKDFIDYIDTLLSAYKRVCVERDAEKERANTVLKAVKQVASPMSENIKGWKERAEKAEAENAELRKDAERCADYAELDYWRNRHADIMHRRDHVNNRTLSEIIHTIRHTAIDRARSANDKG